MTEVLVREIVLPCPPARAFRVFTEHVDLWWPRSHRRERDATLIFEAGPTGRLRQRLADGSLWTMAEVSAWEPARRLGYRWFPGSPKAPTDVDISFASQGDGTLVRIVHRALAAEAQAAWPNAVQLFDRGWTAVLAELAGWITENVKTERE